MSYQQTRSTQDAPFYPQNIQNQLVLQGAPSPANFIVQDPLPSLPPISEDRYYTAIISAGSTFVVTYVPPTNGERCLFQQTTCVFGQSGALLNTTAAQYSQLWSVTNTSTGLTTINSTGTAPLSAGINSGAFNVPGYSTTTAAAGASVNFIVSIGGGSGQAKVTVRLKIVRASNF